MSDTYQNFEDLSANEVRGEDYDIRTKHRKKDLIVLTIHGGGIEGGASELTLETATQLEEAFNSSYYIFDAIKSSGNTALHITSTHFDEPEALEMVAESEYCVSYHGYSDSVKNTKIGGADTELMQLALEKLTEAGFNAEILSAGGAISGSEADNICNRTSRGKGIQLEISTAQRKAMFDTFTLANRKNTQNEEFYNYVKAIVSALLEVA